MSQEELGPLFGLPDRNIMEVLIIKISSLHIERGAVFFAERKKATMMCTKRNTASGFLVYESCRPDSPPS